MQRTVMSPLENLGPAEELVPAAKRLRVVFAPSSSAAGQQVAQGGSNLARGSTGDSDAFTTPRSDYLPLAARRGDAATVEAALRHPLCDINAAFSAETFGWTLPMLHSTPLGGWTTLIGASYHGHASVVRVLLTDRRLCPNMVDSNGDSALFHAAALGLPHGLRLAGRLL